MSPRRPTVAFLLKPFMRCRPDVRLWHLFQALYVVSLRRPTTACILFIYLLRRRSRHPIGFSVICFTYQVVQKYYYWIEHHYFCSWCIRACIFISFVRTVLRVLSSTHLACWFGQMLMKAISWMKSLIASPTPRGVPVSPVRSCLGHCIIRFRNPE